MNKDILEILQVALVVGAVAIGGCGDDDSTSTVDAGCAAGCPAADGGCAAGCPAADGGCAAGCPAADGGCAAGCPADAGCA